MSNLTASERERLIFAGYSVPRAVATMAVPTVISQLITVIYNLADTWFVGLTGNAAAVAAVSLCLPIYNIMTAIANLFGIGASSVIASSLAVDDRDLAKSAFGIALRGTFLAGLVYSLLFALFGKQFLLLIGADESSIGYALQYVWAVIVIGGLPCALSSALAHMIRSTGESQIAGIGITLGAILNIGLDPLFMFVIFPSGNEVLGAAVATALSNCVSLLFFIVYASRHADNGVYSFRLNRSGRNGAVLKKIIRVGLPSFIMVAPGQVSNFILNGMIAQLGSNAAVAGIGIVRKIDSIAYAVNQGITQGMLPMVAYCYTSRRYKRTKAIVGFSAACVVVFALICSVCSYAFAPSLVRCFIDDPQTVEYGAYFLRILCIAVAIYPLLFVIIAVFQAVGKSLIPCLLSLLNKGVFDIVLFFVIRSVFGLKYIPWASPVMSSIALTVGIITIMRFFTHSMKDALVESIKN